MTREEIIEQIQLAKDLNLKSVMIEGIRYELNDESKPRGIVVELSPQELALLNTANEYTDDEILYYSTPYFDELIAEKEKRQQQLKDKAEE